MATPARKVAGEAAKANPAPTAKKKRVRASRPAARMPARSLLRNSTGDGSGALHAAADYFSSAAASLELSEPAYRQRIGAIGEGTTAAPTPEAKANAG